MKASYVGNHTSKKGVLLPCKGIPEIGIPEGHVYELRDGTERKPIFIIREHVHTVGRKFKISTDYIVCPSCEPYVNGKIKMHLLTEECLGSD